MTYTGPSILDIFPSEVIEKILEATKENKDDWNSIFRTCWTFRNIYYFVIDIQECLVEACRLGKHESIPLFVINPRTRFAMQKDAAKGHPENPLVVACKHGHNKVVEAICSYPSIRDALCRNAYTVSILYDALREAMAFGSPKCISEILSHQEFLDLISLECFNDEDEPSNIKENCIGILKVFQKMQKYVPIATFGYDGKKRKLTITIDLDDL